MRPVLSAVNRQEYKFTKWLETGIKTRLNDKFVILLLTEFVRIISTLDIKYTKKFASLDIKASTHKFQ